MAALVFTVLLSPVYLGFRDAFAARYVQLDSLLPGIFLLIFAAFFLYIGGREYVAIDVYSDHLKIKWLWGLISVNILPTGITYFSLCIVNKANCLVLRTPNSDYIIPKELLNNVEEVATQLKQWQVTRRDNIKYSLLSNSQKKMIATFFLLIGVILLVIASNTPPKDFSAINGTELFFIKGHLKGQPNITKPSGKSSKKDITFSLVEYPEFKFSAGATGYDAADKRGLEFYMDGSETKLTISRRDFYVKLTNTAMPTFNEKHYNWNIIPFYQATVSEYPVLTLTNYNNVRIDNGDNHSVLFTTIAGIAVIIFSLRALIKKI